MAYSGQPVLAWSTKERFLVTDETDYEIVTRITDIEGDQLRRVGDEYIYPRNELPKYDRVVSIGYVGFRFAAAVDFAQARQTSTMICFEDDSLAYFAETVLRDVLVHGTLFRPNL